MSPLSNYNTGPITCLALAFLALGGWIIAAFLLANTDAGKCAAKAVGL